MIINGVEYTREKLAGMIDYAVLSPDTTRKQVEEAVEVAKKYGFKGVHTNPVWSYYTADLLEGTGMEVCINGSFPFGCLPHDVKVKEMEQMVKDLKGRPGCIDFVVNLGALKGGEYDVFAAEIRDIAKIGHDAGMEVKTILESQLLTDEQLVTACKIAVEQGADFVKTSSGRSGNPQVRHIKIMRATVPPHIGVKFSGFGGFNPAQLAIMAIAAGASRLGTRQGPQIVDEIDTYYKDLVINDNVVMGK